MKTKLKDLYFGIRMYNFNNKKLEINNLFASLRVLHSIATYRTLDDESLKDINPLSFCFGDTRGHVEYEFLVQEMFSDDWEKVDTWTMYVEPNADYLMSLVNSVSKEDAEKWLEDYYNERKRQYDAIAVNGSEFHNTKTVSSVGQET